MYQDQQMGHIRSISDCTGTETISPTQIDCNSFPPYIRHYHRARWQRDRFVGTDPVTR